MNRTSPQRLGIAAPHWVRPTPPGGMVECPVCQHQSASLEELNKHLDDVHPVDVDYAVINDKTSRFTSLRAVQIEKTNILRARLELRLVRLAVGLQKLVGDNSPNAKQDPRNFWSWTEMRAVREYEEQIVTWEDDRVFERCRFCGQKFSFFLRKHHCRLCGLVVCGDTERECSLEVPTNLLASKLVVDYPELAPVNTVFPIRVCTECRFMLLSRRGFLSDTTAGSEPVIIKLHYQLSKTEHQISQVLPELMQLVENVTENTNQVGLQAAQIGKSRQSQLLQLCSKYDQTVRRVRALNLETEFDKKLQAQILEKAHLFWDATIRPLKGLSQVLNPSTQKQPQINKLAAKNLQEKLVVLREQQFLLEQQITTAKRSRHFDALVPMEQSLVEIETEIETLSSKLGTYAPTH